MASGASSRSCGTSSRWRWRSREPGPSATSRRISSSVLDDFDSVDGMDHATHHPVSLNRLAVRATTHCLIGCGIGEVLGLVIASTLGWATLPSIVLAIALAFVFGYGLTLWPLL